MLHAYPNKRRLTLFRGLARATLLGVAANVSVNVLYVPLTGVCLHFRLELPDLTNDTDSCYHGTVARVPVSLDRSQGVQDGIGDTPRCRGCYSVFTEILGATPAVARGTRLCR